MNNIRIADIDFGRRDARHFVTSDEFDERSFEKSFLVPASFQPENFRKGSKCFVYGIKGAGKSAFLKYLQITASRSAATQNIYFTEQKTADNRAGMDDLHVKEVLTQKNFFDFWIFLFLSSIAKALEAGDVANSGPSIGYLKSLDKSSGIISSLLGASPTLERWLARLQSERLLIEAHGSFKKNSPEDMRDFATGFFQIVRRNPPKKPIYIFVDEIEVSFSTDAQFASEVAAARELILCVRWINEQLRRNKLKIYVVAAVRKELADKIYGADIGKIMRDLGQEISWERGTWSRDEVDFLHPLFEIVLRRIILSESPDVAVITKRMLVDAFKRYFPFNLKGNTQREILDLTTYRPRDLVVLFEAAAAVNGNETAFRETIFVSKCRKSYRDQLWSDFADALRSRYLDSEIELFRKILFQLPGEFVFQDFKNKLDDFSADPRLTKVIEEGDEKWAGILQDIYELGGVGNFYINADEHGRFRFHNRGDTDGLYIAEGYKICKARGLDYT